MGPIQRGYNVECRANADEQFKLVYGPSQIAGYAQAPDLEQRFYVEQDRKADLGVVVHVDLLVRIDFVVIEMDRCHSNGIGKHEQDGGDLERRALHHSLQPRGREASWTTLIHRNHLPAVPVDLQHLRNAHNNLRKAKKQTIIIAMNYCADNTSR